MKFLIVESPTKSKKIQKMLGNDWRVMASYGHIRDLPARQLGVDLDSFRPHYEVPAKSRKTVAALRKALKGQHEVYLATDPDREGEAIAWHLREELRLKAPKRVKFHAITPQAVSAAIANPENIDERLVRAQEGRRILDRLYGYLVSPALSRSLSNRLSAGRVQSPALRLVVDREREIRAFTPQKHFGVRLIFTHPDDPQKFWHADWSVKHWMKDADPALCLDRDLAERVAAARNLRLSASRCDEVVKKPPAPFTTSTLQQAAARRLRFSVKQTMEIAQKLFENGHITYHRTDSRNLEPEAIESIRACLRELGHEVPDQPNTWRSGAGAQEAHEAIRPTDIQVGVAGDSKEEQMLYRLIRMRALSCQMLPARYRRVRLSLSGEVEGEAQKAVFIATGLTLIDKGWLAMEPPAGSNHDPRDDSADNDQEDEELGNPVPMFKEGTPFNPHETKVIERMTKPPARFTEESLVKRLEQLGIGRPSTYASILETNYRRGYWQKNKRRQLEPTELGEQVVDWLSGRFRFMEFDFTRDLEAHLDEIAQGKAKLQPLLHSTYEMIERELQALGLDPGTAASNDAAVEDGPPCPECGKPLRLRHGKNGAFWGCSGYPKCRYTADDRDGQPASQEQANQRKKHQASSQRFSAGDSCPKCKGELVRRTLQRGKNAGRAFLGCTNYPKCDFFSWTTEAGS